MKIEEITAETVSAALVKVREQLGSGAVILATQATAGGGVTVTAAKPFPGEKIRRRQGPTQSSPTLEGLWEEIAELRDQLTLGSPAPEYLPPGIQDLDKRLRGNGVAPRLRRRIVEMTMRGGQGVEALDYATETINDLVPILPAEGFKRKPRVLAFVGPTGVGKTTTIAKLAGRLVHEAGKKVALLSLDTYRVAAVEQLRAYADMLSIPMEVLFTPTDASRCIEEFADRDVILIDTAGRSPHDTARLQELAGFLGQEKQIEVMLVVAANTSSDVAEEIFDRFGRIEPTGVVLTKLDETKKPGSLLELIVVRNIPLAYMTTGQEVPADIERATGDALASRILANTESEEKKMEAEL